MVPTGRAIQKILSYDKIWGVKAKWGRTGYSSKHA